MLQLRKTNALLNVSDILCLVIPDSGVGLPRLAAISLALDTVKRPIEYTKVKLPACVHRTGRAESKTGPPG